MNRENSDLGKPTFTSLVLSLSSTAWIGLGKIADPITGKVNVDLKGAKYSIDTLIMLREKTKGNLSQDELKLLNGVIADLQANYAETVFSSNKQEQKEKESAKEESDKKKVNKAEKKSTGKKGTDEKVENKASDKSKD